jgi:hypothetical protein
MTSFGKKESKLLMAILLLKIIKNHHGLRLLILQLA